MALILTLKKVAKKMITFQPFYKLRSNINRNKRLAEFKNTFVVDSIPCKAVNPYSMLPIDIVIPVIDKDTDTLPFVIDSAREFVKHPLGEIYLISPKDSIRIAKIAYEKNCRRIDEDSLLPINSKDIQYNYAGLDRSKWVYQQLLKWCGNSFCKNNHYLALDADTVFIRPQCFEFNGLMVFDFSDEFHNPYFKTFESLFGIVPRSSISFTSHHGLISIEMLNEIIAYIEKRHNKKWYRAIIDMIDQNEISCVSDYDNYGQFVAEMYPEAITIRYWGNKSINRNKLANLDSLKSRYARYYNTLSFHSWNA